MVGSRDICLRETLCSWLCCPCPEDFLWGFPHPTGSLPILVLPASLLQAAPRVQYCAHSPVSPNPGLTRTREFGPGFQLQQEGSWLDPRRHIRTLRSCGRMHVGWEFLRPRASNKGSERGGVVGGACPLTLLLGRVLIQGLCPHFLPQSYIHVLDSEPLHPHSLH